MNRLPNSRIRSAPADVVGHDAVDIAVSRRGAIAEQRRGFHDHARLTEAALRDVAGEPGALTRMRRQALNRRVFLARCGAQRDLAGANRASVLVDRARAADADAASELRTC